MANGGFAGGFAQGLTGGFDVASRAGARNRAMRLQERQLEAAETARAQELQLKIQEGVRENFQRAYDVASQVSVRANTALALAQQSGDPTAIEKARQEAGEALAMVNGIGEQLGFPRVPPAAGLLSPAAGDQLTAQAQEQAKRTAAQRNAEFLFPNNPNAQRAYVEQVTQPQPATSVQVNLPGQTPPLPRPPEGFMFRRNPDMSIATPVELVPIAGGPAEREIETEEAAAEQKETEQQVFTDVVTEDIDRVIELIQEPGILPTAGVGELLSGLPEPLAGGARNVRSLLDTIRANVGFERLQSIRDASPTGGALGPVSDFENRLMQATIGSLDQAQTPEQLVANLRRVQQVFAAIATTGIKPGDPLAQGQNLLDLLPPGTQNLGNGLFRLPSGEIVEAE